MNILSKFPLIRVLVPLIFGIILSEFIIHIKIYFGFLAALFIVLSLWIFRPNFLKSYSNKWISGLLIFISVSALGVFLHQNGRNSNHLLHYSNFKDSSVYHIRISQALSQTKKSWKAEGEVINIVRSDSCIQKTIGRIIMYFPKTDSVNLSYGDEIIISSTNIQAISNLGNPNEFDYASFMRRNNIFEQVYLRENEWENVGINSGNPIIKLSYKIRDKVLRTIDSFGFSNQEKAVAAAILVGYDDLIDNDLRQIYSGTGAMHILCVSGLHVGIIYLLFSFILTPLKKVRGGKNVTLLLMLLVIWLYALVTGLSPSVFRAATMFSFVSFGNILQRKASVFNSLAASAVVLIVVNPNVIFNIGFQLSYSAVIAILTIQPILSGMYDSKYWLVNKTKDLLAVSIAAQIGTFPIAVYYFNIFPNYFLLTNLIVIPMSFLLIVSGILSVIFNILLSSNNLLSELTEWLFGILLKSQNYLLELINSFPGAINNTIYFSFFDVLIVFTIIIITVVSIQLKRKYYFISSLILLLGFYLFYLVDDQRRLNSIHTDFIVYNISGNSLLEIDQGINTSLIADSNLLSNENYLRFLIKHRNKNKLQINHLYIFDETVFTLNNQILKYNERDIYILQNDSLLPADNLHVDLLFVRNNCKINPYKSLSKIMPDKVVLDASNNYYTSKNWKECCDSLNINFFDTRENGAFLYSSISNNNISF